MKIEINNYDFNYSILNAENKNYVEIYSTKLISLSFMNSTLSFSLRLFFPLIGNDSLFERSIDDLILLDTKIREQFKYNIFPALPNFNFLGSYIKSQEQDRLNKSIEVSLYLNKLLTNKFLLKMENFLLFFSNVNLKEFNNVFVREKKFGKSNIKLYNRSL